MKKLLYIDRINLLAHLNSSELTHFYCSNHVERTQTPGDGLFSYSLNHHICRLYDNKTLMGTLPLEYGDYFFLRFKEGDELAFELVFNKEYNRIVGFCLQFVSDKDKAQSLAQEAFIKLWLNRAKVESINGICSFLYTSAKTDCLNYLRHEKVIQKYQDKQLQRAEFELNREILYSFNFDQLEFTELEKVIQQAINALPEKCRQVFLMSRLEGKKNSEIAVELSISVKSVEANMTRALKAMRISLSEYLPALLVQYIILRF